MAVAVYQYVSRYYTVRFYTVHYARPEKKCKGLEGDWRSPREALLGGLEALLGGSEALLGGLEALLGGLEALLGS